MYATLFLLAVPAAAVPQAPVPPQAPVVEEVAVRGKHTSHHKACPCSPACSCGCNDGLPCSCHLLGLPPVAPVYYQPAAPVFHQPAPRFSAPVFRGSFGGFRGGFGGGGRSGGC